MLGALYRYLREAEPRHFQPMNANFGLLEPLDDDGKAAQEVEDGEVGEEGSTGRAGAA